MTDLKVYLNVTTKDSYVFRIEKTLSLTSSFTLSKMFPNGWNFYRIYNEFVYECVSDGLKLRLCCRKERGNLYLSHVFVYAFNALTSLAYDEDLVYDYDLTIYDVSREIPVRVWLDKFTPVYKYRRFILA